VNGRVYLVGAGPGDPELLTLKAMRLLEQTDAVLHDDLVSKDILSLVSKKALLYDVGKRCGMRGTRQEEIHFLMIELAQQGLEVVRLKGGDPLIFGRAGEEIEALRKAGIEFEIVPGVTAALAAAASAAIPLTLRQTASSLLIITGHFAEDRPLPDLRSLLRLGTTIALYMPGTDSNDTVEKLAAAGVAHSMPCALVSRASTARQKVVVTTLNRLPFNANRTRPVILILGDVVGHAKLDLLDFDTLFPLPLPEETLTSQARAGNRREAAL